MAVSGGLALLVLSSWLLVGLGRASPVHDAGVVCEICVDTFKFIQRELDSNATLNDIVPLVEKACIDAMKRVLNLHWEILCPGIINSYAPVIQYVMTQRLIEPMQFCEALHLCTPEPGDASASKDPFLQAIDEIICEARVEDVRMKGERRQLSEEARAAYQAVDFAQSGKMVEVSSSRSRHVGSEAPVPRPYNRRPQSDTLRVLQFGDIHLDRKYSQGSPSLCGFFMCCRDWYNGSWPAGKYGEWLCDLPVATLELMAEAIRDLDPQPDFIIYTGDNPSHELWNSSWATQLNDTLFVVDFLSEKLPNVTIYPVIGNHESYPESEYYLKLPEYQHLNVFLATQWRKWVDLSDEAVHNITEGGYYWFDMEEGLRAIVMNTNYGYNINFYALLNDDNPDYYDQLDWIEQQLAAAEAAGKKVLLVGHVPPKGGSTLSEYGEFYINTSRRYAKTIIGNIFGHTHRDEFKVVQDTDGVYAALLISPSMTPYGRMNPSFRVHLLDRSNGYRLMDYEQYHLDLMKANALADKGLKPAFELSYSAAAAYGLPDLSPPSWAELATRFATNDSLISEYHYNFYGKSLELDRLCGSSCRKKILCNVLHFINEDYFKCLV